MRRIRKYHLFSPFGEKAKSFSSAQKREHINQENYRLLLLLPIYGKMFEKVIFDDIYEHTSGNQLLIPRSICIFQWDPTISTFLIYITQRIYDMLYFLIHLKAFDKVWHDGLTVKLKNYGISDPFLALIESYSSNHKQGLVLDGKCSEWSNTTARVPLGSVLDAFFFLIW